MIKNILILVLGIISFLSIVTACSFYDKIDYLSDQLVNCLYEKQELSDSKCDHSKCCEKQVLDSLKPLEPDLDNSMKLMIIDRVYGPTISEDKYILHSGLYDLLSIYIVKIID